MIRPAPPRARTREGQLETIRRRLLAEAEHNLALAERWRISRKQGERNGAGIAAQRGIDAISAVALIDAIILPEERARRAAPESAAPRRGLS